MSIRRISLWRYLLALAVILVAFVAATERTAAVPGAKVYIISPENGAKVKSPVLVRFGLSKMGVAPAGVNNPATGHHHLLIDTTLDQFDSPLPATDSIKHFGGGQTEAEIELKNGKHTLQLLLADYMHVPHQPPVISEVVEIEVVD